MTISEFRKEENKKLTETINRSIHEGFQPTIYTKVTIESVDKFETPTLSCYAVHRDIPVNASRSVKEYAAFWCANKLLEMMDAEYEKIDKFYKSAVRIKVFNRGVEKKIEGISVRMYEIKWKNVLRIEAWMAFGFVGIPRSALPEQKV